jgi:hypothetical protein
MPADSTGVALWVLTGNHRGRHFYAHRGFTPDRASRVINIAGRDLEELRYQRPAARR